MYPAPAPSVHKPRVKAGARIHTIAVESQTRPGIFYTVDTVAHSCSCPAGHRGRMCWHLGTALAYSAWRKQQVAAPVTSLPSSSATLAPLHTTEGFKRLAEAFA